jgi:hypothetical protein
MLQDYLACGTNSSDDVDFFSLNAYEWCGDSSYTVSGYSQLEQNATGYTKPIFFSETGCNTVPPRTFSDQAAIFGPEMVNTWSGAIVYEWIEEANNYGLISYGPEVPATATGAGVVGGFTRSGTPTPISPDFANLQSQWSTLTPSGVALTAYSASASNLTPLPCPSSTKDGWLVQGDVPLPTVGQTGAAVATGGNTATATSASASATATKGSANGGKEIAGMSIGLAGVMLGFVVWL